MLYKLSHKARHCEEGQLWVSLLQMSFALIGTNSKLTLLPVHNLVGKYCTSSEWMDGWNPVEALDFPFSSFFTLHHFTVNCLVTCPLNGNKAEGDLVLIKTSLFLCKWSSSNAYWYAFQREKQSGLNWSKVASVIFPLVNKRCHFRDTENCF